MNRWILPLSLLLLLGASCKKESLRPEDNQVEGVTKEELQASPEELEEVRFLEGTLREVGFVHFKRETHRPAPGLMPIDWKVEYKGKPELESLENSHSLLMDYIVDLQDFLANYPAEKFYFLGVHKEFITKLQLSMALQKELETNIAKLRNGNLEGSRIKLLKAAFELKDKELKAKGMSYKIDEEAQSIEPVLNIGFSWFRAKALADYLKIYIADGEELLKESHPEYNLLEAGKIEIAKGVLEKLEERLKNTPPPSDDEPQR